MEKNNPHDKLFKATFTIRREAVALMKTYAPKWLSESLDYEDFELSSETYVKENMKDIFMDILWETKWKSTKKKIKLSFLLEHKSYPDKVVWIQLGEYLFGAYGRQILNKEPNHVIIPVLVYHDKAEWKVRQLLDLFDLPNPDLAQFIPNYQALILDVNKMTDKIIIQTEAAIFLKSTFLLFKYKGQNDQLLRIIEEIFIFVKRDLTELEKSRFIKLNLHYLFSAFKLNQVEADKIIKKVPPMIHQEFRNTYDVARDEGRVEGKIEGKIKNAAITSFRSMLLFLRDFPDWTTNQVSTYANLKPTKVEKFKKTLAKHLPFDLLFKEIKKQFFKDIELEKKEEKELIKLTKDYLEKQKN